MEEQVIMSLGTYNKIMESINVLEDANKGYKAQVNNLQDRYVNLQIFELDDSYDGCKELKYTKEVQQFIDKLKAQNPNLEFKELPKVIDYQFAKPLEGVKPDGPF